MLVGVNVAIIEGNTILLTLREDFEVWCLPGGHVDEGESLADAARRETLEETGLEVELTRLVGMYSRVGGWRDFHLALFAAQVIGGSLTPQPTEVLEARFFPFDALPEHLLLGQAYRIQDAVSGATGIVKTESVATVQSAPTTQTELYTLRDQSGLPRREFYQRSIPPLPPEQIRLEVPGYPDK